MNNRYQYLVDALESSMIRGDERETLILTSLLISARDRKRFFHCDERQTNYFQRALLGSMPKVAKLMLESLPADEQARLFSNINIDGETSLHMAVRGYYTIEFMEYVFQFADSLPENATQKKLALLANHKGYTPLHLLQQHKRYLIMQWLLNYMALNLPKLYERLESSQLSNEERQDMLALVRRHEEEVYPYINRLTKHGTVLHAAIECQPVCPDTVALLINYGAELYHAKNKQGLTGFELLLALPSEELITIFTKMDKKKQVAFLSQYEKWLCEDDARDGQLLYTLTGELTVSADASSPIVESMRSGSASVVQHHDFEQFSYVFKLNKILNELSERINDLESRSSQHNLKQVIAGAFAAIGGLSLIGALSTAMMWLAYVGSYDHERGLKIPGTVPVMLALAGLLITILYIFFERFPYKQQLTAARISPLEWMNQIKFIKEELLPILQQLEAMQHNELRIPGRFVVELESALKHFDLLGRIPPTRDTMLDMGKELFNVLKRIRRDIIRTNQPFSFFHHREMHDEIRLEIKRDEEMSSYEDVVRLLDR